MRRFPLSLAAGFVLAVSATRPLQDPAALIAGSWHGTSICVDKQTDRACRDEEVIYDVGNARGPRGPVDMKADKIVNGVREDMGTITLTWDSTASRWTAPLTSTRFQARWDFSVQRDSLHGALIELPSQRLVRRVAAVRRSGSGTGGPQSGS